MSPAPISSTEHTRRPETGDLFNSPLVWGALALVILLTLATVAAIGVIYYGDDVHTPAWSERSVPRPTPAP